MPRKQIAAAQKRVKKLTPPPFRARSDSAQALLFDELRELIQSTRVGVAQAVNSALVLLYWQVGERVRTETLKSERAAYGGQIVSTLSRQLAAEFGNGYSLRRLVAVELKLERFKAADKGQMELYLRWLEKHEMERGEETPIGLILCADKGDEQVELLRLDKSGIRIASYLTDLPPRQLLQRKLHEMMIVARTRLEGRLADEDKRE